MTFQPPQQADAPDTAEPVPWARPAVKAEAPITERKRRIVAKLPSWEPLPPGEILVTRRRED